MRDLSHYRVGEYMDHRRQATSLDVLARLCDGLRLPGQLSVLQYRQWSVTRPEADAPGRAHPSCCRKRISRAFHPESTA